MTDFAKVAAQHRVLVTVQGGVAYPDLSTAPFGIVVRDLDNGDAPFTAEESAAQAQRAQAITELVGLVPVMEGLLRDGSAVIDSLTTQVEQMKGMFPDDDGAIASALDDGADVYERLRAVAATVAGRAPGVVTLPAETYARVMAALVRTGEVLGDVLAKHGPGDAAATPYQHVRQDLAVLLEQLPRAA